MMKKGKKHSPTAGGKSLLLERVPISPPKSRHEGIGLPLQKAPVRNGEDG